MQVKEKKNTNPKREGLHQDCPAEFTFRLDIPKVNITGHFHVYNFKQM